MSNKEECQIDLDGLEMLCDTYLRECPDYWYEEHHLADGITYEPAVYFMIDASPEMVKALIAMARKAPEPESVPIPTCVNMARMMLALSYNWLKENAPEHLPDQVPAKEASHEST